MNLGLSGFYKEESPTVFNVLPGLTIQRPPVESPQGRLGSMNEDAGSLSTRGRRRSAQVLQQDRRWLDA